MFTDSSYSLLPEHIQLAFIVDWFPGLTQGPGIRWVLHPHLKRKAQSQQMVRKSPWKTNKWTFSLECFIPDKCSQGQEWILVLKHYNSLPCAPQLTFLSATPCCSYLQRDVRLLCWHGQCGEVRSSKAGCNSRSLSRASLERRDLQDLRGPLDPQGPQAWMEPMAHRWVPVRVQPEIKILFYSILFYLKSLLPVQQCNITLD